MQFVEPKRTLPFLIGGVACVSVLLCLSITPTHAQSRDAIADLAGRINRERTMRGLVPYAQSAALDAAAQAHANDIARTGINSHTGSDGSDVRERVARAGYGAYSWGRRVGENWAWYPDAATAMQMWMNSAPHTDNILHPVYREFGIGIAPGKPGTFIYVVDFGAQPNVLPIFIQRDGRDSSSARVTLALSNETYAASGDGANTIGLATQVEISSSPDFTSAQWQTFAPRFDWTMNNGSKSVYVKFRDARGRIVTSSDSIGFGVPAAATTSVPKPTATLTPRPRPTATRAVLPLLTTVAQPTELPSPTQAAALESTAMPDVQIALSETPVPLPPDSAESLDPREDKQMNLLGLGTLGVAFMLGVFATVTYLGRKLRS